MTAASLIRLVLIIRPTVNVQPSHRIRVQYTKRYCKMFFVVKIFNCGSVIIANQEQIEAFHQPNENRFNFGIKPNKKTRIYFSPKKEKSDFSLPIAQGPFNPFREGLYDGFVLSFSGKYD